MSRFRGTYNYSVDAKGRFNIPAPFRKILDPSADETFVIVQGPSLCLRAYPQNEWEKKEDELDALPETPENLKYVRKVLATQSQSQLDKQGRIAITPVQKEIAGIKKSIQIIGHKGFLEIWSEDTYRAYIQSDENESFDELFNKSVQSTLNQNRE